MQVWLIQLEFFKRCNWERNGFNNIHFNLFNSTVYIQPFITLQLLQGHKNSNIIFRFSEILGYITKGKQRFSNFIFDNLLLTSLFFLKYFQVSGTLSSSFLLN